MNRIIVLVALVMLSRVSPAQVDRIEPPFWWTGMENTTLQLMVHGEDIAGYRINIDHHDARLISVDRTTNNNYLFIKLDISRVTEPATVNIEFRKGADVVYTHKYELLGRKEGSAQREGFDNSDVLYLLMPDRFANGDPSNDEVEGMKEGLNRGKRYGWHGGDIQGIEDHLAYIGDMGFTAIWLNPVVENDMAEWSYHGYAATDFYKIDSRFGTNSEYVEMIEEAQSRGLKIIMDMIFNHCGLNHWWMDDLPSADWLSYPEYVPTNHRRTVNQDPYASQYDKERMTRGWFVEAMPDLNQENPFLAEYLIQNSIWWIEYAGLSGIRMDTYPYPDKHMMAEWNRRVLNEYPHFNIVGEEWSINPAIVSYWQKGQDNPDGYDGELPSLMDFPLQSAVSEALTDDESWEEGLVKIYEMLANDFLYPHPFNLVVMPDNHDMPRFFMQMDMDRGLYLNGIVFFLTTRGIPQIYYGSEILMTHKEGDDHGYIRKDFPGGWPGDKVNAFTGEGMSPEERDMQDMFRRLLNWRKTAEVIHTGRLKQFAPENGTYVYFRYNDDDMVMVIINKNPAAYELELGRFKEMIGDKAGARDVLSGQEYELGETIRLLPRKPYILEIK
ncbi:MAG: glycoside hydrolase family 13 protein [Bacteroidales bacterium]